MRCEAKLYSNKKLFHNTQCRKPAILGIFCNIHCDYIQRLDKRIAELQAEKKRVEELK